MLKKLMFAAYAAVMMSFTTLAGNATWQLASGQAFRGDGQACLYQTYTSNYDSDFGTIELNKVVAAFATGTLDLSSPPHYYDYVTLNSAVEDFDIAA